LPQRTFRQRVRETHTYLEAAQDRASAALEVPVACRSEHLDRERHTHTQETHLETAQDRASAALKVPVACRSEHSPGMHNNCDPKKIRPYAVQHCDQGVVAQPEKGAKTRRMSDRKRQQDTVAKRDRETERRDRWQHKGERKRETTREREREREREIDR